MWLQDSVTYYNSCDDSDNIVIIVSLVIMVPAIITKTVFILYVYVRVGVCIYV